MSTTIRLGNEEVLLDKSLLSFTEATLNQFLQKYASQYDYYVRKHAEAMYIHSRFSDRFDLIKAEKFRDHKEGGATEKLAEAKALAEPEVQASLESLRLAKHNVNMLTGYLKSMDMCHNDALNYGHNVRKEISVFGNDTVRKVYDHQ